MKYLVSIIVAAIILTAVAYYHHVTGNLSTTFAGFLGAISFFTTMSIFERKEKAKKDKEKKKENDDFAKSLLSTKRNNSK